MKTLAQKMVFITGTDTDVGKTVITAGLAAIFRRKGYKALAVKPYQTGTASTFSDADIYDFDGAQEESRDNINPVTLEPSGAPWAASRIAETSFDYDAVLKRTRKLTKTHDILFVEGVGGLCVPITGEKLVLDMVKELGCPLIIVARGRLGTINHSLLTIRAAQEAGIPVLGIIISGLTRGVDPVTDLNPEIIQHFTDTAVLGEIPVLLTLDLRRKRTDNLIQNLEKYIQCDVLEKKLFS